MLTKDKILLLSILTLAFFLRVWNLHIIPFGFTPDEASFGYDAYSLLTTGKDQWGHAFPMVLESFGDFKMPLYSYLTIPFVWIFGLTKFAVRLPNAILGTVSVYATYLLVKQFLMVKDQWLKGGNSRLTINYEPLTLLAAFLLAINPWHVMMSRGAFEANLTTFLMPSGVYLFLKGLKQKKYLILSSIVFGLNLFSYHSARLVTPLILLVLVLIYKSELSEGLKRFSFFGIFIKYKVPLFLFGLFLALAFYTLTIGGAERAKDITIFSGALEESAEERFAAIYQGMSAESARFFHNKYLVIAGRFLANYTQYVSINFLFLNGPAEATYGMIPGRGVLYFLELPFLIAFLYSFFVLKNKKAFFVILFWILLAPIAAALTTGRGFSANRAVIMQPALSIAIAFGAYSIFIFLKSHLSLSTVKFLTYGYFFAAFVSFIFFVEAYFFVSPYKTAKEMLYGNLEVAKWLTENSEDYEKIVVSKRLSEPHIYVAFAERWSPADYQQNTKNWERYKDEGLKFVDQLQEYELGKYLFTDIKYDEYLDKENILLVGRSEDFPDTVKPLVVFLYPNGQPAVLVVEPYVKAYAKKLY